MDCCKFFDLCLVFVDDFGLLWIFVDRCGSFPVMVKAVPCYGCL